MALLGRRFRATVGRHAAQALGHHPASAALLPVLGACLRDPRGAAVLSAPDLAATAIVAARSPKASWVTQLGATLLARAGEARVEFGPVVLDGPIPCLSVEAGGAEFASPLRRLAAAPGLVEVEDEEGRRSIETHPAFVSATPIQGGATLLGCDLMPLRAFEAHPEKDGNGLHWGGHPVAAWAERLGEAATLIEQYLAAFWADRGGALRTVVPVGFDAERHVSASFREAPGLLYLSLHPDRLTMAEAIVHEAQHSRLNLLTWTDPVLRNGHSTWTPSPVRPDLRPIMGVLLAAHAFVPVAALHRSLMLANAELVSSPTFERRRTEVLEANRQSLQTLGQHADPTGHGVNLLHALHALDAWSRQP